MRSRTIRRVGVACVALGWACMAAAHASDGRVGMALPAAEARGEMRPTAGAGLVSGGQWLGEDPTTTLGDAGLWVRGELPVGRSAAVGVSLVGSGLVFRQGEERGGVPFGLGRVDARGTLLDGRGGRVAVWGAVVGPLVGPIEFGVEIRGQPVAPRGVGMAGLSWGWASARWTVDAGVPLGFLWMGRETDFDDPVVRGTGPVVGGVPVAPLLLELRAARALGGHHWLLFGVQQASPGVGWALRGPARSLSVVVHGMPAIPEATVGRVAWCLGGISVIQRW